ncbi:MAG: hypothetical protein CVV09_13765 [Gammaproteobacteria bacterium HGW-Gammaproteobacteria-13]|nr:MAG: hypothetical protein CVV09_13765 [Gammaproteobacteria bacterium HGW-Gammaproteobacteria-13]
MEVLSFKLCRADLVVKSASMSSRCRICLRQGALLKSQTREDDVPLNAHGTGGAMEGSVRLSVAA